MKQKSSFEKAFNPEEHGPEPKEYENASSANEKNVSKKKIEFDDLLVSAGEFGIYQLLLFFASMPFQIFAVFSYFGQMFLTESSQQYWCWIPELENLTALERRLLAIPRDTNAKFGHSQCQAYSVNWSEVLTAGGQGNPEWNVIPCQYGWEFNKSEIPYPTIVSDLGWVCDRDSYQANAQAIFFLGSALGGFVVGWVADSFGRIPAVMVSNLFGAIGGIATAFVSDFLGFAICRFIVGMSYDNCLMMTYLLILEYVAPAYRSIIANLSFAIFFTAGSVALPWIALACGHWKVLSLVLSVPMMLGLLAPLFLLESPRWLLTKGRVDDAVNKLHIIAKLNKKKIPENRLAEFKQDVANDKEEKKGNFLEMLKHPVLRNSFILICCVYMSCVIVFDALVRSIGQLDFDFFISFSVLSLTELPSLAILAFVMDWFGRRWLIFLTLANSCIFCLLTNFVGGGLPSVLCAVVARFTANMAFNSAMQWGAELMPTSVRASGLSVIHVAGYIATIASPYIVYLEVYVVWLPLVIVACLSALGATISLVLPETAKKDMPQSFDDAVMLSKSQKFWDMPCVGTKEKSLSGTENISFEP